MYQAFPGSDYYEGFVAIGVSPPPPPPRRQSRVSFDFGDWALLVFTYFHQRSTAIKTALVVLVVVVGFALVVTLALPVSFLVLEQVCRDLGRWSLIFLLAVILVRCAVHGIGVGCRRRSGLARSQGEERIQINQVPVVFDTGRSSTT